ncbi:hypothetical protein EJB05_15128, partial [Eragrostis curvula]
MLTPSWRSSWRCSVALPHLRKEIIFLLPEILGDQSHAAVVSAPEKLLQEDSEVVAAVFDAFSDLNLYGCCRSSDYCDIVHPNNCCGPNTTFTQMFCEAFLKELKSVDDPRDHKAIIDSLRDGDIEMGMHDADASGNLKDFFEKGAVKTANEESKAVTKAMKAIKQRMEKVK